MIRHTIIAAAACEAVSLLVIGPNIYFPYGLAIGVCASIVSLNVIGGSIARAVERGKEGPVFFGYILRILLYGGAFLLAVKTDSISGAAAVIGFLLPKVTLYIRYGLLPWIRRKTGKEPQALYRADTKSRMFIKEPLMERYVNGRTYLTHRRYKKVRIFPEPRERTPERG